MWGRLAVGKSLFLVAASFVVTETADRARVVVAETKAEAAAAAGRLIIRERRGSRRDRRSE